MRLGRVEFAGAAAAFFAVQGKVAVVLLSALLLTRVARRSSAAVRHG